MANALAGTGQSNVAWRGRPDHVVIFDEDIEGSGARRCQALRKCGIKITKSRNKAKLLAVLDRPHPDLVVLVVDSVDTINKVQDARKYLERRTIPTMVVAPAGVADAATAAGWIFDRRVDPGTDMSEFAAGTTSLLRRTRYLLELSVDTGLPGTTWLREQLQLEIDSTNDFSLVLFDIDRFKSVVDVYGFARANNFLTAMAVSLRRGAQVGGSPRVKIAHIGGDDFLAVCTPAQVLPMTCSVVTAFERAADEIYDSVDAKRGYLEIPNLWGTGKPQRARLVTLSIGVAESTSENRLRRPAKRRRSHQR